LIFHPAELISETLLLPLFTVVFYFLHYADSVEKAKKALFSALAGVFSALALLTHGMISAFPVLFSLFLVYQKKYLNAALFAAGLIVTITPFLAVKSCHYGKFSGLQANSGFNIFLGNNPRATGLCYMRPGDLWRKTHVEAQKTAQKRQISTNRYFLEKVYSFWKDHPLKGSWLYLKKIFLIFSGREHIAGADGGFLFCRTETMNYLRCLTLPVILLAFWGLFKFFREKKYGFPPFLILAFSLFLMQMLTVTSGRYRLLMFPALLFLAAYGLIYLNIKKWWGILLLLIFFSAVLNYGFMGADKGEGTALLGEGHFIKGDYPHAKELLLFAKKRFRDTSRIDNMLGNIAEKEQDFDLARQYYTQVTKKEPFMPEGWMNLANITPDPLKAERCYTKALEVSAPSPSADLTYNYAKFLHAVKRSSEAEQWLEKTFKTDKNHVMAWNLSGLIAAGKKDFKGAAEKFLHAARLQPREAGFWRNTAITARMAGDRNLAEYAMREYMNLTRKK
jgi:Flp pilus assembly protein TadD